MTIREAIDFITRNDIGGPHTAKLVEVAEAYEQAPIVYLADKYDCRGCCVHGQHEDAEGTVRLVGWAGR